MVGRVCGGAMAVWGVTGCGRAWRGESVVGCDRAWQGDWTWRSDGREWAMACHTWMVRKPLAAANAPRNEVMITCKPGGVEEG